MRKVKAWLVTDCGAEWSDAYEYPVIAFTDEAAARECARVRQGRKERDVFVDLEWCAVHEIELVLDDGGGCHDRDARVPVAAVRHILIGTAEEMERVASESLADRLIPGCIQSGWACMWARRLREIAEWRL